MDAQTLATLALVPVAVILAVLARRGGRSRFGLGPRRGVAGDFLRGAAFSLPFLGAVVAVFAFSGLSEFTGAEWSTAALGIAAYFLVLFLLEEVVFRALLLTGLGVLLGRLVAVLLSAVLVATAYAFAPGTGVLPLIGAVVTNVLHGLARVRSGRIWWGLGQRWAWNSGVVALGFADSGFALRAPVLGQVLTGPPWLTGGGFGLEGGVIGIAFLLVMIALVPLGARSTHGPWTLAPRSHSD